MLFSSVLIKILLFHDHVGEATVLVISDPPHNVLSLDTRNETVQSPVWDSHQEMLLAEKRPLT